MNDDWSHYEESSAETCVIDIDTYELVYMNEKARQRYQERIDTTSARKCYEVLCDSASPCSSCSNNALRESEFEEWNRFDPFTYRPCNSKASIVQRDGHRYRVQEDAVVSKEDDSSHRFAGLDDKTILINEALRMTLEETDAHNAIQRTLEYIGQALGAQRAYVFEYDGADFVKNTYEWCAYDITPEKEFLSHVPFEAARIWFDEFEQGRYVVIPDVEKIKDSEPLTYEYLIVQNITSVVVSPLRTKKGIYGFYGFDNPPADRLEDIFPLLKTLGHIIDSLISRRSLMERLHDLSLIDQMTRLGNRRALNEHFAQVDKEASLGIAFCDVCDLKRTNDIHGHAAGDKLLIDASACLRSFFHETDLFRIGGDEFLILAGGVDEEDFMETCNHLRSKSIADGTPLAIGSIWMPHVNEQLDNLLQRADMLMYADKQNFYRSSAQSLASSSTKSTMYFHADKLTQLVSMDAFMLAAEQALSHSPRPQDFHIVFFNIKNFKRFNVSAGKRQGDEVLIEMRNLLWKHLGNSLVSRFADDHFAALANAEDIAGLVDEVHNSFAASHAGDGLETKAGIYRITGQESIENACDLARMACDSIRDDMESRTRTYDEEIGRRVEIEEYVIGRIDEAIAKGDVHVCYQPAIRTISRSIHGFEALARWDCAEHGAIAPDVFIPALEKTKQTHKLDLYVVGVVCERLQAEIGAGRPVAPISVNISPIDFVTCDIFAKIEAIRKSRDIPADLLTIEITESILLDNSDEVLTTIRRFVSAGYDVSMDDFGSGFSSLNQFSNLDFTEIKLDRVFLENIGDSSKAVVSNLVKMSKQLNVRIVAEGVETAEQAEFLKRIGCNVVQGFFFSGALRYDEAVRTCAELGICFEEEGKRGYLDKISSIDLITDRTLAIIEYSNDKFSYLHVNDAYIDVLFGSGRKNLDEVYHNLNATSSPLSSRFRKFAGQLEEGQQQSMVYVADGEYIKADARKIASHGNDAVFSAEVVNVGALKDNDKAELLDTIYRQMYFMFSAVYLVDLTQSTITPISHEPGAKEQAPVTDRDIGEAFKHSLAHVVHPDDFQDYLEWTNLKTLPARLAASKDGIMTGYFRGLRKDGSYVWRAHYIFAMPDGGRGSCIYAVSDMDDAQELSEKIMGMRQA